MKGKYVCPNCRTNDWEPTLWVDGPVYDECNKCGYHFTSKDLRLIRLAEIHHERHGDMDGHTCLLAECALHYPKPRSSTPTAKGDGK